MTAEAYARMMKALLPPGRLWRLVPDSLLSKVFLACGDELARIDQRGQDLLRESDPRTTEELLPDFERVLGQASTGTVEERRARVVSLLVRRQRYRPIDFKLALAPLLGQVAEDVVVIQRGRAFILLTGQDDREIFRFFIYRNPAAPGTYDLADAQAMVDRMQPSHTLGQVIESITFLCDDAQNLCERDLLGV